jgi:hypothetical protein
MIHPLRESMDFSCISARKPGSGRTRQAAFAMVFVMVIGFLAAGCTSPGASLPSAGAPAATIAPTPWTGSWESTWGTMVFTQTGNKVTGTYTHDNGKIEGTVSGNTLTGTWSEAPTYAPTKDAGDFVITLASDEKSFTGNWRYGSGTGKWDGAWNAKKK